MDDKKIQAGQFESSIEELAAFAKNKGNKISYGDILKFFPEKDGDDAQIDDALQALSEMGIEVLQEDFNGGADVSSREVSDPVWAYYRSISRFKLLTFEEEVETLKVVAAGKEAEGQAEALEGQLRGLTGKKKEQAEAKLAGLKKTAAKGQGARELFINSNLRLVVSIAKRYQNRGLPLMDLIQEGNLGLMKSLDYYDYKKGLHFSTYATWWIRQSIMRAISNKGRVIRLPVHMAEQCSRYNRACTVLSQKIGREPCDEEVAEYMGLPVEKIEHIRSIIADPVSLDAPVREESPEDTLADFIRDQDSPSPEDAAIQNSLHEQIFELLDELDERERDILIKRFGLDGGTPMTLEEVGKEYKLTRERIRQIENKALRRLRRPNRRRKLQGYI